MVQEFCKNIFSVVSGTIKTTSDDAPIQQQPEMDFVEQAICNEDDIAENQMKQFDIGDSRVLLIKQQGILSAIGTKCSHYGALLSTGGRKPFSNDWRTCSSYLSFYIRRSQFICNFFSTR